MPLHRYFIKTSFDGTAYNGWQVQKNSPNTVQQKINEGLSSLLNEKIEVQGCCRTDTGVHAKTLFAHFDSKRDHLHNDPHTDWLFKFNRVIPRDICIDRVYSVTDEASARYDATARTYQYVVSRKRDPFMVNRSYYFYGDLDVDLMNKAAAMLRKQNDFSSFSKLSTQAKSNQCRISEAKWERKTGSLVFTIRSDRFLRGMVRMITGTLFLLGRNKITLDDFIKIINSKDCRNAGPLAPACGLYLVKVEYPENIFKK